MNRKPRTGESPRARQARRAEPAVGAAEGRSLRHGPCYSHRLAAFCIFRPRLPRKSPSCGIAYATLRGFHGTPPSLVDLDAVDLRMTTDFRRVYASVLSEWMCTTDAVALLRGDFPPLGLFASIS